MATKKLTLAKYDPKAKASFASKYVKVERLVKSAGVKVWFDAAAAQKVSNYVRTAEAAEVANMALFLASEESSYSTGSEFLIDGGLNAL